MCINGRSSLPDKPGQGRTDVASAQAVRELTTAYPDACTDAAEVKKRIIAAWKEEHR